MTACPIRYQRQVPDRKGKIFYTSITSLSHISKVSGGETQKLLLARAIYKSAPIMLLDEPTAALDPIAESELYQKYNQISEGKTTVFISHRLASTNFCNRIILIEDGAICEEGTHRELLDKKGKYYNLFEMQAKYYREEEVAE